MKADNRQPPFQSMDELFAEIESDKLSSKYVHNRYPVRFIFLPNFERMKELFNTLTKKPNCKSLDLVNKLPYANGWLTADDITNPLKNIIKNAPENDYVVVPLSEIVRFYPDPDLISTFITICSIETISNNTQRIYIPLVGMHERFKGFSLHLRSEWGPIWEVTENITEKLPIIMCVDPDKCTIYPNPTKEPIFIEETNDWLSLWKRSQEKLFGLDIICNSDTLSYLYSFSKPDSFFDFKEVRNQKDIIKVLYNIEVPIPYLDVEKNLWVGLYDLLNKESSLVSATSFELMVAHVFNVRTISDESVLALWIKNNTPIKKWLLKYYVLSQTDLNTTYIYDVFRAISDYSDEKLELELWTRVFKRDKIDNEILTERLELIREFYSLKVTMGPQIESTLEAELNSELSKYKSVKEKMRLLTGITFTEKKKIIELSIEANDKEELSKKALLTIYKVIYPTLHRYLDSIELDNAEDNIEWIKQYFDEYRWSKVFNTKTKILNEILNDKNGGEKNFFEWYYNLQSPQTVLKELPYEDDNIIWLDALGLEWINLLYRSISDFVTFNRILMVRSNLPTTTDSNRFDIDKSRHIIDLDKFIHQMDSYNHPDSFVKELDFVENFLRETLAVDSSTAIVSDHGLSTFVRGGHGANKKILDDFRPDHGGRCVWTDKRFLPDTSYVEVENPSDSKHKEKWAIIPLQHDSLGNLPRREVHGGATPEEVIVPILLISPSSGRNEMYNINPESFKVKQGKPVFDGLSISPKPRNPVILGENHEWKLSYNESTHYWAVNLEGLGTGHHNLKLIVDEVEMKIKVEVTGGMKVRDLI